MAKSVPKDLEHLLYMADDGLQIATQLKCVQEVGVELVVLVGLHQLSHLLLTRVQLRQYPPEIWLVLHQQPIIYYLHYRNCLALGGKDIWKLPLQDSPGNFIQLLVLTVCLRVLFNVFFPVFLYSQQGVFFEELDCRGLQSCQITLERQVASEANHGLSDCPSEVLAGHKVLKLGLWRQHSAHEGQVV